MSKSHFPNFEARVAEANRAALRMDDQARAARQAADNLGYSLAYWEQLRSQGDGVSLSELALTAALRAKLEGVGLETVEKLLTFWLNSNWQEKISLPGIGGGSARKVTLALKLAFNRLAPANLRNPVLPGCADHDPYLYGD